MSPPASPTTTPAAVPTPRATAHGNPIPTDGPIGELLAAMGRSEMRPAHIHFIVAAPGHESVTTHLFVEGDPYLESDAVFGVKDTLIAPFTRCDDPSQAAEFQIGSPFYLLEWDFVLARTGDAC